MTDMERVARHFALNNRCSLCLSESKNVLHLLRDCSHSSIFWKQILEASMWNSFSLLSFEPWLHMNYRDKVHDGISKDWDAQFAVTIWWI